MQPQNVVLEESVVSGVSWGAVFAGAFVAAALSLILIALGTGLGFTFVSPWSNQGASATTLGVASILWLILMQIVSGSLGAYIAGRLRTKWVNVHTDEVFFRDTAHGFLVWAVSLVLTAAFLTSAATTLIGAGAKTGAAVATVAGGGIAAGASSAIANKDAVPTTYLIDSLFRSDKRDFETDSTSVNAEVARIFAASVGREFTSDDKSYLVQLVANRTGMNQEEAEKRVSAVLMKVRDAELEARQALDTVRKVAAHTSLWMFISLLIGAFCASYAGTIGGRQRDNLMASRALPNSRPHVTEVRS